MSTLELTRRKFISLKIN